MVYNKSPINLNNKYGNYFIYMVYYCEISIIHIYKAKAIEDKFHTIL